MKVLLLSSPHSAHTQKWAKSLAGAGLEIYLFGLFECDPAVYAGYDALHLETLGLTVPNPKSGEGAFAKLRYLRALPKVKEIIRRFRPDIVHAHFATSYGLLGALAGFQPYILSVWGAEVFEFPHKSPLHRELLAYNFRKACRILSTSQVMARETRKYTSKEVVVTPFGIDFDTFKPKNANTLFDQNDIVIGTIKGLEEQYGIEDLIRMFKILVDKYPNLPLKLLIVGGGSLEAPLKQLVKDLGVDDKTVFTGRVSYDSVVAYHNMLSVYVALSVVDSESFGVAVIEASACEKPVVVSNVGGLPEVVEDGRTGFVVPARSPEKAAVAVERLILDEQLRTTLGKAGRQRGRMRYNWEDNLKQMIAIYEDTLKEPDHCMGSESR